METPQELLSALNRASKLIDAKGELPSTIRKELLELIEKLSTPEHSDAGYLRRARLAILCAAKVVDRMAAYTDEYLMARSMLSNAIASLMGKYDLYHLKNENGTLHTEVINLFEHGEIAFISAYAGMACFSAVNTVIYDTDFQTVGMSELEISPDEWDASYHAALAESGSATWEGKGGDSQRQGFWMWYLSQAIPQAWDVLVPLV